MNLFFPVYKRIEKEVIALTNSIFFDDKQMGVYSLAIGDLLLRCSVEIESIAKELYIHLGGTPNPVDGQGNKRDLYFDTDCISLLVDKWKIDEKKVQITYSGVYLSHDKAILTPLHKAHKRGSSGSRWKQAYQNIKHNRSQSIKFASIENLINALGALYILNLYYADEKFWYGTYIQGRREFSPESEFFTPFVANKTKIQMKPNMVDDNSETDEPILSECIYVKKHTENSLREIHRIICRGAVEYAIKALDSNSLQHLFEVSSEIRNDFFVKAVEKIGFSNLETIKRDLIRYNLNDLLMRQEIILNNDEAIYPTLSYADFLVSAEGIETINEMKLKYLHRT